MSRRIVRRRCGYRSPLGERYGQHRGLQRGYPCCRESRRGHCLHARAPQVAHKTGRVEMLSHVRLEIGLTTTVLGSRALLDWTPRNASYTAKECELSPDSGPRGVLGSLFYAADAHNFEHWWWWDR